MPRIGKRFLTLSGVVLVGIGLVGCRKPEPQPLTQWASRPESVGSLGQQALIDAGTEIEKIARSKSPLDKEGLPSNPLTTRNQFFPKQKADARAIVKPFRAKALAACKAKWDFVPSGLGQPPLYLRGLRLLGQSFLWDIEEGIKESNYPKAIAGCSAANRLGIALLNGGGYDATLGTFLIDRARLQMIPALASMNAYQLGSLAQNVQSSWKTAPAISSAIKNERESMLLTLQEVQDMVIAKKFTELDKQLGKSADETITLLESLNGDPTKIKSVFDWIGEDIQKRGDWTVNRLDNPKTAGKAPELKERRNWRLLYRYFGSNLDSLSPMLLRTYAKTQIFIVDLYLRQKIKAKRALPANLKAFNPKAVRDPFTGDPLFYRADRNEFQIYSAGADGIDNGGQTDSAFNNPDLTLEQSSMLSP